LARRIRGDHLMDDGPGESRQSDEAPTSTWIFPRVVNLVDLS
jgi:hypothetical protein